MEDLKLHSHNPPPTWAGGGCVCESLGEKFCLETNFLQYVHMYRQSNNSDIKTDFWTSSGLPPF